MTGVCVSEREKYDSQNRIYPAPRAFGDTGGAEEGDRRSGELLDFFLLRLKKEIRLRLLFEEWTDSGRGGGRGELPETSATAPGVCLGEVRRKSARSEVLVRILRPGEADIEGEQRDS